MPDPDDPAFYDRDFESDVNIADKLEQIRSKSKIDQRRTERGISKEELFNREEVRLAIVKKKYFPDPPESPNLLTWMEGEMMRKLYQDDPQTWTFERLSECFPVTAKGAKKIVKCRPILKPSQILKKNEIARKNWKLLAKGKLENSEKIQEHLEKNGHQIFDGKFISSSQRQELEQAILKDYQAKLLPPKPDLSGQFGQLLLFHQKRAGVVKQEENSSQENVVEVDKLLDAKSDFADSLNTPNPYGESTLISASGDGAKYEKKVMTVQEFRHNFYREMKKKAEEKDNENAKQYFKWLKTEQKLLASTENSNKEAVKVIEEENDDDFKKVQKFETSQIVLKTPQEVKKNEIKEKINIPLEMKKENATYQVGDCHYDSEGDFMYRIPEQIPESAAN